MDIEICKRIIKVRILTAGCKKFVKPIELNLKQAKFFGYDTTVYDLGNLGIDNSIVHEITDPDFAKKSRYTKTSEIGYAAKSLHKGDIVLDCLKNNPNDLVVYMDGDAMLLDSIDEVDTGDYDIGITIRDARETKKIKHKNEKLKAFLGTINAGIIIFAPTDVAKEFTKRWSEQIVPMESDQKALNQLVNPDMIQYKPGDIFVVDGVRFKCFDGGIYNFGHWPERPQEDVKILHCKGHRFRGHMQEIEQICKRKQTKPLRGFESDFETVVNDIKWEQHSISNVEAYYWWALIAKYKPDVVIESGICKGRSTDVISRACDFYNIPFHIALELSNQHQAYIEEKFSYRNIQFHYGKHSDEALKGLTDSLKGYRCLLIVDGPKEYDQSMHLYKVASKLDLVAIGVHDCSEAGKCYQAIKDARSKYWKRADLFQTNNILNDGLFKYNSFIAKDLQNAYLKNKPHYERKMGKEITQQDYESMLGQVGICEIEAK